MLHTVTSLIEGRCILQRTTGTSFLLFFTAHGIFEWRSQSGVAGAEARTSSRIRIPRASWSRMGSPPTFFTARRSGPGSVRHQQLRGGAAMGTTSVSKGASPSFLLAARTLWNFSMKSLMRSCADGSDFDALSLAAKSLLNLSVILLNVRNRI